VDSGDDGEGAPRARRGRPRHHDPEVELKLIEAEKFVDATRLKMWLMPGDWRSFEDLPVRPRKTKVTVAFDADMVEWFRRMGAGWPRG
jgi:uncharacterized protein (DUF4415 family)